MCRRRSLVCDIENRPKELLSADQMARITKSDLVVLDYHLTAGDETDVLPALSILEALADSPHANLVVVYTKHELRKALRDVFIRFRGINSNADFPAEYDGSDLTQWLPEFDNDTLFAYLSGDRESVKTLIAGAHDELRRLGVKEKDINAVVRAGVELWLKRKYAHVAAPIRSDSAGISRSSDSETTPWLHFKNVFIAFVSKSDEQADLIDALESALLAWNPGVLRLIISNARSRMQQRGFAYEQIVIGPDDRQIGLLYHALESEESDSTVRLRDMLRRLFDGVGRELSSDSGEFGARLIQRRLTEAGTVPSAREEQTRFFIEQARAMANVESQGAVKDAQVIAALNAFLCSRDFDSSHLWAGAVFRDEASCQWWICAAPSCEILPRKPLPATWQSDLYPALPMLALRLKVTKTEDALAKATQAKHIFVAGPEGLVALRVLELESGQPRPEMLILHDAGRIDENHIFKAYTVVKGSSDNPELQLNTYRAIAQLRNEYADRFLHQTGHHTSRIGVDFVPFGQEPPASP
jgi:hypothetical protein